MGGQASPALRGWTILAAWPLVIPLCLRASRWAHRFRALRWHGASASGLRSAARSCTAALAAFLAALLPRIPRDQGVGRSQAAPTGECGYHPASGGAPTRAPISALLQTFYVSWQLCCHLVARSPEQSSSGSSWRVCSHRLRSRSKGVHEASSSTQWCPTSSSDADAVASVSIGGGSCSEPKTKVPAHPVSVRVPRMPEPTCPGDVFICVNIRVRFSVFARIGALSVARSKCTRRPRPPCTALPGSQEPAAHRLSDFISKPKVTCSKGNMSHSPSPVATTV